MRRDKHIEEMAEIISAVRFHKTSTYIAEALYNAGYRKSTDVAREVFADIEKNLVSIDNFGINQFRCIGARTFAELKNKYESEGADDVQSKNENAIEN